MNRNKIFSDFGYILLVSCLIPALLCLVVYFYSHRQVEALEKSQYEVKINDTKNGLSLISSQVELVSELALLSREVMDYLTVSKNLRPYIQNRFTGRMLQIVNMLPIESQLQLFDHQNNLIYSSTSEAVHPKVPIKRLSDGFNVVNNNIVFMTMIKYDDQRLKTGHLNTFGSITISILNSSLKKSFPLIKVIPDSDSPTETLENLPLVFLGLDEISSQKNAPSLTILIIVVILMVICFVVSNIFLTKRIISPIYRITSNLIGTSRDTQDNSKKVDNILMLEHAAASYLRNKIATKENEAVAKTMKMLAHDIRRPFSMIQGIMDIFTTEWMRKAPYSKNLAKLRRHREVIKQSISSINSMMDDVIEVGGETTLTTSEVSLSDIIAKSLKETLTYGELQNHSLSYELNSHYNLDIDEIKIKRVVNNILGNALEAMATKGSIRFRSKDLNNGYVEVSVFNSGTFIPLENRKEIFDVFYTANKPGGTGLGLAISKRFVEAHGGKISCDSNNNGTTFSFTLPASKFLDRNSNTLPDSIEKITASDQLDLDILEEHQIMPNYPLKDMLASRGIFKILIVDDEKIYHDLIKGLLPSDMDSSIEFYSEFNCVSALKTLAQNQYDLIITDLDFGTQPIQGVEFVKRVREFNINIPIIVCSNRCASTYGGSVQEAGANKFYPKPLKQDQLFQEISNLCSTCRNNDDAASNESNPNIILVEDNEVLRDTWEHMLGEKINTFSSPGSFFDSVRKDISLIANCDALVVDMNFSGTNDTGAEIAKKVRKMNVNGRIYLYSNSEVASPDCIMLFDASLDKTPSEAIGYLRRHLATTSPSSREVETIDIQPTLFKERNLGDLRHDILDATVTLEVLTKRIEGVPAELHKRITHSIKKIRQIAKQI